MSPLSNTTMLPLLWYQTNLVVANATDQNQLTNVFRNLHLPMPQKPSFLQNFSRFSKVVDKQVPRLECIRQFGIGIIVSWISPQKHVIWRCWIKWTSFIICLILVASFFLLRIVVQCKVTLCYFDRRLPVRFFFANSSMRIKLFESFYIGSV